jgi:hypothetical protein
LGCRALMPGCGPIISAMMNCATSSSSATGRA